MSELKESIVPEERCSNCNYLLPEKAFYCAQCGQKVYAGKVPLKALLRELASAVFDIDNKLFRTFVAIFIPGKLTLKYFEGRRKYYIHPARFFIIAAIIFLAVLNYSVLYQVNVTFDLSEESIKARSHEDQLRAQVVDDYERFKAVDTLNRSWQSGLDSMMLSIGEPQQDSSNFGYPDFSFSSGFSSSELTYNTVDFFTMPVDSFLRHYKIEGLVGKTVVGQIVRIGQNPTDFWKFSIGQLSWMLLIMMPVLALFMKLFYIRRKRYFIEHLYFGFHVHTFLFVLFSLFLIVTPNLNHVFFAPFWIGAIYIYVAMLRYYKQGWFKTLVKFGMLHFIYQVLIIVFVTLTFLVSGIAYN